MKLTMSGVLSSKHSLQSLADKKDKIAEAVETLNSKQNREYLQKSTPLNSQQAFSVKGSQKSEFNSLIADPNAPTSLRKAAHYLVYNASSFEPSEPSNGSFSFE